MSGRNRIQPARPPRQVHNRTTVVMVAIVAALVAVFVVDSTWHQPFWLVFAGLITVAVACPLLFRWATGRW